MSLNITFPYLSVVPFVENIFTGFYFDELFYVSYELSRELHLMLEPERLRMFGDKNNLT